MSPDQKQDLERASSDIAPSVCAHLAEEHRRLPEVLSQTEWRMQQRLFPGAERCFAEFRNGLELHLDAEKQVTSSVLGPSFDASLSAKIRIRSEILRRMAAFAAEAIHARDCGAFASIISDLRGTLVAHRNEEESRVFPLVEQLNSGSK